MRWVGVLVVVNAFASHAAVADVKRHAAIPEVLQGSWAAGSDGCGSNDKSVIVLSAKAYASGEAKCAVAWVSETAGAHGPIYSARLQCPGPPVKKASASNLIIRPEDASRISMGPDFDHLKIYRNCAAKE
jgi:hypothetical protein